MGSRSFVVAAVFAVLLWPIAAPGCSVLSYSDSQEDRASILTVPEQYFLQWISRDYNDTGGVTCEILMEMSSNGTARYVGYWPLSPEPSVNVSGVIDQELVNFTRLAMDEDGLCFLNGTYNDANEGFAASPRHEDKFNITTPCGNRSLTFSYDAMIGVVPRTCVALDKIAWQLLSPDHDAMKINIEVTASLQEDSKLVVSAVIRNDGSHEFTMSGVSSSMWPARIVRTNGFGVVHLPTNGAIPLCIVTVGPGATYSLDEQTWNASGLAMGDYVVMVMAGLSGMAILEITQDLGHVNVSPVVKVGVTELEDSNYEFDASGSCDAEDFVTLLEVRWDWYSDGTWDTSWSYVKVAGYTFENLTGYNFTVEVRDTSGLVSSVILSMTETKGTSMSLLPPAFAALSVMALAAAAFVILKRRRI